MGDDADQMSGSIGAIISANCGDEGYYQGRLAAFCKTDKTITLACPLKDGIPMGREVVLAAGQIQALKVLRAASGEPATTPTKQQQLQQPVKELLQQVAKQQSQPVTPQKAQQQGAAAPHPPTPQAVVAPMTTQQKPLELSDIEAFYKLKPALKKDDNDNSKTTRKTVSMGDQSDTPSRQKRQARFEEKQQWVSRPLGGSRRRRRNSEDPTCSSARSSPTNASDEDETLGIAPTPLFRKYEPQVANPTTLHSVPAGFSARGTMRYSASRHASGGASSSSRRNAGPSGIPSLDAARGRVTGKVSDLSRPLDMDELETDFDFEGNLKLFNKETDVDDDFYEAVEKPKMSVNYAHYENIIDDPERCTSWTNMHSKAEKKAAALSAYSEYESEAGVREEEEMKRRSERRPASRDGSKNTLTPPHGGSSTSASAQRRRSSMGRRIVVSHWAECEGEEGGAAGLRLPVLDEKEKARLAKETRSFLGEDAYSLLLADRVLEWMFTVIASQGILVERVALLAADATAQSLLDRILMQLSARGCRVSLYGAHLEKALPLVELVATERDLPSDVQIIVDLDPSMQRKSRSAELTRWLDALAEAHVICLDHVCPGVSDYERVHALMVGALSTSVMDTMRKASMVVPKVGPTSVAELFGKLGVGANKQSRPHIGLADLGVPFAWFGDEASSALSALFATTFVAPCNLK